MVGWPAHSDAATCVADAPVRGRYTAFVHVVGPDGLVAQHDQEALGGFFPTSAWLLGVPVIDSYTYAGERCQ